LTLNSKGQFYGRIKDLRIHQTKKNKLLESFLDERALAPLSQDYSSRGFIEKLSGVENESLESEDIDFEFPDESGLAVADDETRLKKMVHMAPFIDVKSVELKEKKGQVNLDPETILEMKAEIKNKRKDHETYISPNLESRVGSG